MNRTAIIGAGQALYRSKAWRASSVWFDETPSFAISRSAAAAQDQHRDLYLRGERYRLHESLDTPEKIAEAIRQFEQRER